MTGAFWKSCKTSGRWIKAGRRSWRSQRHHAEQSTAELRALAAHRRPDTIKEVRGRSTPHSASTNGRLCRKRKNQTCQMISKKIADDMGGYGSGAWHDRDARRTGQMRSIDLAYLNRRGLVRPYQSGSLHWSHGGSATGSIGLTVLPRALCLDYRTRSLVDEEWTSVVEEIPFTWTSTAFGGRRHWFQCPSCLRNCRVLYGGSRFRCRRCNRLTYESQYRGALAAVSFKSSEHPDQAWRKPVDG